MYTYRYLDYQMDVSTQIMIGGMKAVSFAFNVADGYKTKHEMKEYASRIARNPNPIIKEMAERQIHEIPSFFEYLSYMNNFNFSVVGPYVDYKEYENWIKLKGCYANIPFTLKPIIRCVILTGLFGYLYAVIYPMFPLEQIL